MDIINLAIGAIGSAIGLIIGYLGFMRSRDKDIKADVESQAYQKAETNTKLDHISRGVDNIRVDLKANEKQINGVAERVTRVEESSKQAHLRINDLEEEIRK